MDKETVDTYNKIAEDWHKDHQLDTWWIESTDKFISLLKRGDKVLDVGCGGGTKSKYLIQKGLQVTGIDISEKMIEIARREIPSAEFFVMDMENMSELKEKFDGVFVQAVLLHTSKKDLKRAFRSMFDRLKPNGYLCIAIKEKRPDGKEEEIKTEEDYGYQYKRLFSYFTIDEIKNHLSDLQMEISYESITPSGNTNWLQIIAKKK